MNCKAQMDTIFVVYFSPQIFYLCLHLCDSALSPRLHPCGLWPSKRQLAGLSYQGLLNITLHSAMKRWHRSRLTDIRGIYSSLLRMIAQCVRFHLVEIVFCEMLSSANDTALKPVFVSFQLLQLWCRTSIWLSLETWLKTASLLFVLTWWSNLKDVIIINIINGLI